MARTVPSDLNEVRSRLAKIDDPLTLLAGIFAFSPVGIQIYEPSGRSILTNRAFREMFGSEPPPEYNVLRDEIARAAGVLDLIHRAFRGETVHMPAVWYDPRELTQVTVRQGRRVAIESTFFPVFDSAGRVSYVAIVFRDLTEERTLREQLERERDLLTRLIGVLGHDLQQPLTAILASVSSLLRSRQDPDRLRTGLLRIRQSSGRMSRMLANFLDLTRIRVRGELPVSPRETDMSAIATTLVDELRTAYPDREIALSATGDTTGTWDPDRVSQVLANLLTNAISFGSAGTVIDVTVADRGGAVSVAVHNHGPAIPEDQVKTIFEPFRRADGTARPAASPGLGLGLFIAHQIVAAHGGRIAVSSSDETGTTFEVSLPRRSDP